MRARKPDVSINTVPPDLKEIGLFFGRPVGRFLFLVQLVIAIVGCPLSAFAYLSPTIGNPNLFTASPIEPIIDETTGALLERVAINVPPGRNNLTPDLALAYNNQRLSDGPYGYGWSLSIPYIERLNKVGSERMYTDNYYASSQGGELATTSVPNQYLNRIDDGSFTSYSLVNNVWTAYDKQGTRFLFGTTTAGRQAATTSPSSVSRWMLEEVRDTNDNYGVGDADYTFGGPTDTWGRSWTTTELANGNFRLKIDKLPDSDTLRIDYLRVNVYYSNASTTTSYIHLDQLGSTNVVTNAGATAIQTLDYYPYGTKRINGGTDVSQREYIGQFYDEEDSLSYLNARYYDGNRGQFVSEDPSFLAEPNNQNIADPQSLNSYSYANDNPISKSDPNGRFATPIDLALTIGFVGYDLYKISTEGFSTRNTTSLGLDATGFLPLVPAGLIKATQTVNKVSDVARAADKLSDAALVCRGGGCSAAQFQSGTGVTLDAGGKLQGVSVNSATGASFGELTKSLPHNQVGVTTVGDVRKLGGNVVSSPKLNGPNPNPFHSILQGITPQQAQNLFKPTVKNPNKR